MNGRRTALVIGIDHGISLEVCHQLGAAGLRVPARGARHGQRRSGGRSVAGRFTYDCQVAGTRPESRSSK
jgi:NAD(P)-dependent dehydrogenase (short-subunit alcohol dehydrogenase family)